MNTVDLRKMFGLRQDEMLSRLTTNGEIIKHPGTKGDASELHWIDTFRQYAPSRYRFEKAFVIDADGQQSEQIDIIVFDQYYSPFLFNQDGAMYVPAENVYAAFEVKQSINKDIITYAGKKVASVRRL